MLALILKTVVSSLKVFLLMRQLWWLGLVSMAEERR